MQSVKWTSKIKYAVVLERVRDGTIMLELRKDEENKLSGQLTKKELPAEGCSRSNGTGKKVRGRRRYQI